MLKKFLASFIALTMAIGIFCIPAVSGESPLDSAMMTAEAAEVTINATDVTLYGIDTWAEEYISIPSGFNKTFQLKVSGADSFSCRVVKGDSVTVSSTGLIEPVYETWYWNGNIGSTFPSGQEGEVTKSQGEFGESTIQVTAGGKTFTVAVEFVDYADYYANEIMDKYIEENITSSMTAEEKLDKICQFAASYDYSVSASSATTMIVKKGGDCWASCDAIITMCEKLGIKAWIRNGNKDPGAGSGHKNVMVEVDGTYYEADAGYSGTAPRYYSVIERTSLYSYRSVTGGIEVYQFDGPSSDFTTLDIPQTIDGKTVVGIGESFIQSNSAVTKVTIPSTVTYIGKSAFNSCYALETLNIPASVTSIGEFAFTYCESLDNFTCDVNNPNFTVEKGVLYNKSKTKIISVPCVSSVTIPKSVTTIGSYSFYYNKAITSIVIPSSVTTIGEGAFGTCDALASITFESGKDISFDSFAFAYCSNLKSIEIPEGVTSIAYAQFYNCGKLEKIIIPDSVTSIGDYAFSSCSSNFAIYGNKGSYAETYAKENNIPFKVLMTSDIIRLSGKSRYETAIAISNKGWTSAETVVLANGLNYADALAGVPLAYKYDAPILLTAGKAELEENVMTQILNLKPKKIVLLGGSGAISEGIEKMLSKKYQVERIAGMSRYETAIEIGKKISTKPETAIVVTGTGYADALSISPHAALNRLPIVYSNPNTGLTDETVKYLSSATDILIVGGEGIVRKNTVKQLGSKKITRVWGMDRYETSYKIAEKFDSEFGDDVMFATGTNFPDALAGGVLAAKLKTPLLLTHPSGATENIKNYILKKDPSNIYLLGGEGALPNSVIENIYG